MNRHEPTRAQREYFRMLMWTGAGTLALIIAIVRTIAEAVGA